MPIFNPAQSQYFIDLLTGGDNSLLTWQIYYDPKDGTERKDLAKWFNGDLSQYHNEFLAAEGNKCGIYVCINEMDGNGRNGYNTVRIRALFADFDGMAEPVWPLTPHFVSKRDETHGHAFWLVDGIDVDQYMYLQKRISICMGTDGQVTDPSRVARLPGTGHFKDPENPQTYNVAWDNSSIVGSKRYTFDEICNSFPLEGEKLKEYEVWVGKRDCYDEGTGFSDDATYVNKFTNFIRNTAKPAVEGGDAGTGYGGTYQVIRVASFGYDYGLTLETTQNLMWEHYNPRCEPPWDDSERNHFEIVVGRAYRYAKNAPGCRTAGANFEIIPPPPPPPLPTEVVRVGDRLSESDAAIISPILNAKSSHYELAQCYDGLVYHGVNIIRYRGIFYNYNGRSWAISDDKVVKASIQRFYSRFKPSDTLVRGVFNSFCDLVTVNYTDLESGTWLDSGKVDDNLLCFKNGLVDLGLDNPAVMEHTPNYFTFNELEYDYMISTHCPKFREFLHSIWPNDPDLILQLQEWMGYCLTSDVSLQKFATFIGKSRGGKGVLADIICEMVGRNNTVAPPLSKIMDNSTLYKMSTARLALIPDAHSVHSNKRDDVLSGIKALTGGDPLTYDVKFKDAQTSRFKIKLILSTNNMPEFIDASGALVNRMLVFPFKISFAGRENPKLREELMSEISAIAQWSLEGLRRLRHNGKFTEAASGIAEKENLKDEMNPLGRFIDDVCQLDLDGFVVNESLYDTYLLWCKQHHIHSPLSQNKLTRILKSTDLPISQERRRIDGKRRVGFRGLDIQSGYGFEPIPEPPTESVN